MSKKVESKESKSLRDKMRTLTVSAPIEFRKEIVEWGGMKFEIREANLLVKGRIEKASTRIENGFIRVDSMEMAVRSVIEGCYVPGTDERVFEDTDYDDLVGGKVNGFLDAFADVIADMLNVDLEAKKKSSPKTMKSV